MPSQTPVPGATAALFPIVHVFVEFEVAPILISETGWLALPTLALLPLTLKLPPT